MKYSGYRNVGSARFLPIVALFFFGQSYIAVDARPQDKHLPARTGYVNDFAGVVDGETKQRLEARLEKVKRISGIEFGVAIVQTTGAQDIFDFSRQLARDWDVGARNSKKSLLLVISVNEQAILTQFSRSVQGELPEGILGELSQRMRGPIGSGQVSEALSDGVYHLINALAKRGGFSLQEIDGAQSAPAGSPVSEPSPGVKATVEEGSGVSTSPVTTAKSRVVIASPSKSRAAALNKTTSAADDEAEVEEVELTLTLPSEERIARLKEFLERHTSSKSRQRAIELLVSTHAGLGDQKLKNGDSKGGLDHLMLAIKEAPDNTSEKLFSGVISQIPINLYFRGERSAAFSAAELIEAKFGVDPKRLLAVAGFYLGLERGEEAARLAAQAVKLAPDLAEAHHALGLGLHISLRLDEAAAEYKRALELDPSTKKETRRSLADLRRAAGRAEEALALYREQLAVAPADKAARAGLVLCLLDLGRTDEGKKELTTALQDDPRNLPLLSGAAYWFAAHSDTERALELARKAVDLEPRYTWSQIAMARALLGEKKPLEAERAIRFARQYGKFPTLDYELANVLAAVGLYEEAADVLLQSFTLKEGQIEARLAGGVVVRESDFLKLLAPERQASIFQFTAADNKSNAAMLKELLVFKIATNQSPESSQLDESRAAAAAKEFASGADDMRVYRQLYAAGRLLGRGIALQTAFELTEAARSSVNAALGVPAVTVAVQAEEFREIRARALAQGGTPDIPQAPHNVLANILRGRIEDLAGWALFNQGRTDEAVEHLKRAASILPEGTPSWRSALWHLGAALDQAGNKQEALSYYIKSYNSGEPDPVRRGVIEQLYLKTNGSLDGLERLIGAKVIVANVSPATAIEKSAGETSTVSQPAQNPASAESTPTPAPAASPLSVEPAPAAPPEEAPPAPESSATPKPEAAIPRLEATHQSGPSPVSRASFPDTKAPFRPTVKVTGRVQEANRMGLPNVVVVLISPRGTVLATTTDSDGNYSFVVSPSQLGYRIIPSKGGYIFEPVDKMLAGFSDDQKEVDFVGVKASEP